VNPAPLATGDGVEPWTQWALDNTQMGIVILDQQGCIVYLNRWVQQQMQPCSTPWRGQTLAQAFPALGGTYLESVLKRVTQTGFAAFLSQSLHPSPFPFYQNNNRRSADNLIKQSVYLLPMGKEDMARTGQRHVMIQINDVTQSVNRERLLKAQATTLHGIARTDALTGIGNRRHFDEALAQEFRQTLRANSNLSLILLDIDHFKLYNDTLGHIKGDEALTLVAGALRSACHRTRDISARYGGEEMALILPETDLEGAKMVARTLQFHINDLGIEHPQNSASKQLTVSMGVACLTTLGLESPAALIHRADLALYKAKHEGRDSIFVSDQEMIYRH
jgi:diguanylate cyclase (GGDEF)-like protein